MVTLQSAIINASSMGNNTIITGVSGQVIQVISIYFQCNVATTLTVRSGTTNLTGSMSFLASGGFNLPADPNGNPLFQTNAGDDFILHFSGLTGQAGGAITYYQF